MQPREAEPDLFGYLFVRYLGIDVVIGATLTMQWLLTYAVRELAETVTLLACLFALRFVAWTGYLWVQLRPAAAWRRGELAGADLLELERVFERMPRRLSLVLVGGWCGYFAAAPLLIWTVWPELVAIAPSELWASALQVTAVGVGAQALYVWMTRVMLDRSLARLDLELGVQGIQRRRERSALLPRLIWVGSILATAPILWVSSMSWLDTLHARREQTLTELRSTVELAVLQVDAGRPLPAELALTEAPPHAGESSPILTFEPRAERASAAAMTADGRWLTAERVVVYPWSRALVVLGLVMLTGLAWAIATIAVQAGAIMFPIRRLSEASRRMIEVGDLRAMGQVPVIANDEIGDLTASFNFVRAYFERLAVMAEAVAAGDLTVDPAGKGDLPNAFRGMVDRLHAIVVQLRVTSLSLGAAISDIHAATREQETATTRQLDEIKSLDEHMRSLAGSAMLVEQASGAVLGIAERSASNTSALAGKIRTLSEHNHAVEQLLEQVREIAGRSDLLALNGSLEATRAGEAGRGFALVAGEMRRLAERITGIVDSMRSLVADIHDSSVSAVLATEQAGALAAETTQSARSITNETSRQSVETGQASDATAKLANILAESSVSIVQTRAIAEALDQQADQLERTLTAFTLREFS